MSSTALTGSRGTRGPLIAGCHAATPTAGPETAEDARVNRAPEKSSKRADGGGDVRGGEPAVGGGVRAPS